MLIKSLINRIYGIVVLVLLIFAISSCKVTNNATTSVQMINASPDAGSVNLYLSGNLKTTTPVNYSYSSGYLSTIVGNQTAEIKSSTTAVILVSTPVNLTEYSNYSIYLCGLANSASLGSIVALDDLTAPSAGKAKLRFVNTVVGSPQVNLIANSSTTLFTGIAYKSVTGFVEIMPGTYNLAAASTAVTSVSVATASQTFVSGKIYTIYFKGAIGATTDPSKLGLGVTANN